MIEVHDRLNKSTHILVDDDGWSALKQAMAADQMPVGIPRPNPMLGIDVFRDECPCDPYPKSDATDASQRAVTTEGEQP